MAVTGTGADGASRATDGRVLAVRAAAARPGSGFAKPAVVAVHLRRGRGVDGDVHAGVREHRQVHLVDVARYELLRAQPPGPGRPVVEDGYLGENVTTSGVDLLALGPGTVLRLGGSARVRLTGRRFPRHEDPATDPSALVLDGDGVPVGQVGVFAEVLTDGDVRAGDGVVVEDRRGGPLPVL